MKLAIPALLLSALAAAQYPGAQPPPAVRKTGWEKVTEAEAKRILGYLAGPETAGRGTGQAGFQKAADFMAAEFKRLGLKPMGDDGTYFQSQIFRRTRVEDGTLTAGSRTVSVSFLTGGPEMSRSGPLLFLKATDDIPSAERVKGAIVVLEGGPLDRAKRASLRRAGPSAVLTVDDAPVPDASRVSLGGGKAGRRSTVDGRMTTEARKGLVGAVYASVDGTFVEENVPVPNVIGYLPPTVKEPTDEVVGIGAHLDHLGVEDGVVYPGADDDGSGCAALVLAAAALAADPGPRRRGIVFMAFHGEEMGLLGSAYYAANPKFPHAKMVAEIQMDMVGRASEGVQNGDASRVDVKAENIDTLRLVGSKRISTELDDIIQRQNKHTALRFKYDAEDVYTRSDHYNFAKNGVPIAFFFDGFHPDYHRPTDTIEKIEWLKLTTVARLAYLTVAELAERADRPKKN